MELETNGDCSFRHAHVQRQTTHEPRIANALCGQATHMEMSSLKMMCDSLQRQLSQLGEKPGAAAAVCVAAAVCDVGAMMVDSKSRGASMPQDASGVLWGQHGGDEIQIQRGGSAGSGVQQHAHWSDDGAVSHPPFRRSSSSGRRSHHTAPRVRALSRCREELSVGFPSTCQS